MYSPQTPIVGQNPFEANIAYVKKFFGRPIILIYAILVTISAVFSFYVTYQMSKSVSMLRNFSGQISDVSIFQSASSVSIVISGIIYATILFALYYIFFTSRSSNPAVKPNAGFTIIQVYLIIVIILISIVIAALVFIGVIAGFAGLGDLQSYWNDFANQAPELHQFDGYIFGGSSILTGFVIVVFVIATIFALVLTYFIAMFRFLSSAKYNMRNLVMKVKGSTYVGVWTIIVTCFMVFGALISLIGYKAGEVALSGFGSYVGGEAQNQVESFMSISKLTPITNLLSIAQMLFLAIITLSYSGYIKHGIRQASAVAYAMPAVPVVPVMQGTAYAANPYMAQTAPAQRTMAAPVQPAAQPAAPVQPVAQPAAQPAAPVQSAAQPAAQPAAPAQPVAQPAAEPAAPVAEAKAEEAPAEPAQPQPVQEEAASSSADAWPTEKICPNCGAVHSASAVYCGNCGTRIP